MKDITLESKAREDNGMGSRRDWLTSRHERMKTTGFKSTHRLLESDNVIFDFRYVNLVIEFDQVTSFYTEFEL